MTTTQIDSDAHSQHQVDKTNRLSDLTKDLVDEVEHSWARLDHEERASLDLRDIVRRFLRPRASAARDQSRQHAAILLTSVHDDLKQADAANDGHGLTEHFRVLRHLIMSPILEVVQEVKDEYSALIPRPHMPHWSSDESKREPGKHRKNLSLGSFKRSISPPIDARPLKSDGDMDDKTWAAETAIACGMPHSVPRMPGVHEPKEALDIVAEDFFHRQAHQDPLREVVVLTSGHHRVEDIAELF